MRIIFYYIVILWSMMYLSCSKSTKWEYELANNSLKVESIKTSMSSNSLNCLPISLGSVSIASNTAYIPVSTFNGVYYYTISSASTGHPQTSSSNGEASSPILTIDITPGRTYQVSVRAGLSCPITQGASTTFTIPASPTDTGDNEDCVTPFILSQNNETVRETYIDLNLQWAPIEGAAPYIIRYRNKYSNDDWSISETATSSNVLRLSGLQASSTYEIQVAAKCAPSTYSPTFVGSTLVE